MMCFKDMTFCDNPCCSCNPDRKLTDEVKGAAEKWWGSKGAPICVADICGGGK